MRNVLLQKVYFACTRKREPFGAAEGFIVEQLGPVLKEQDPPLFPPEVTCSAFVKFNGGCFVALTHSNGQQKVTVINHCDYLLCLSDTTALAGWIEKPSHLHF